MHTHSEYSHDSVCKIEDMLLSQIKKGTEIFAVTDHFDTYSFNDYDIFTPIKKANETVAELNKKYCHNPLILSGIEISEGFWYPEIYEKVKNLADFDVVLGSVHLVRYKDLRHAYSKIDFSKLSIDTITEYLYTYFDDVLTMLDTTDIDVLAHLTCPLRYINGKYKMGVEISKFENIEKILKEIIYKEIALEVNTSSYEPLNDFMPGKDILKKYYDMGGRLITLGSDAHTVDNASQFFNKATEALKEIGFKNIYYYKRRKPYQIEI